MPAQPKVCCYFQYTTAKTRPCLDVKVDVDVRVDVDIDVDIDVKVHVDVIWTWTSTLGVDIDVNVIVDIDIDASMDGFGMVLVGLWVVLVGFGEVLGVVSGWFR